MVADKQMFTGAQISSVNIVTAARCGWISRGRRRGKYKRVDKDGYKDMFVGNIFAKHVIQRAWWCPNTRDLEGKRCPNSSRGQRKQKQASMRNAERQKKMIVISQDNRPAALTLWPSSALLLITQTKLLWAVGGRE